MSSFELDITNLINKKKFDKALELISSNNLSINLFIGEFGVLAAKFSKKPSLKLARSLVKLFSMQESTTKASTITFFRSYRQIFFMKIFTLLEKDLKKAIESQVNRDIFIYIAKNKDKIEKFIEVLSKLTEIMIDDLNSERIMDFLEFLLNTLQKVGNEDAAKRVKSWISTTKDLRGPILTTKLIKGIFRATKGTYAPIQLLAHYFESKFKDSRYRVEINFCNEFSEFLFDLTEIVYELIDTPIQQKILNAIDIYTSTVASGYEYLIMKRMNQKDIDGLLFEVRAAPSSVCQSLISNFSTKNPLPYLRCIENTIERWKDLPTLKKTVYIGYQTGTMSIKPIFWLIILQRLIPEQLMKTYNRLFKSDLHYHKILVEISRAFINFNYHLWQSIKSEPTVPIRLDLQEQTIKDLKKLNDMIKFSDDELHEIVDSSYWRRYSERILSKVIELKNFCLYCSYNMPPGAETCPKCGHKVTEVDIEAPKIDYSKMKTFFGQTA